MSVQPYAPPKPRYNAADLIRAYERDDRLTPDTPLVKHRVVAHALAFRVGKSLVSIERRPLRAELRDEWDFLEEYLADHRATMPPAVFDTIETATKELAAAVHALSPRSR